MKVNHHLITGIPFGYIRADSIHHELFDQLCDSHGKDVNYDAALADHLAQKRREFDAAQEELAIKRAETGADRENPDVGEDDAEFDEDRETELFADAYHCDEPIYEGEHEGVKYRTSWLGGAQHLWVFESPVVTLCRPCSLCVPNAGNLDDVGTYEAYGLPTSWLTTDFIREQIEKDDYEIVLGPDSKEYWRIHGEERTMRGPFGDQYEAAEDCYKKNLQRNVGQAPTA